MTLIRTLKDLMEDPKRWLITGVAGFIGSNLLEFLLTNNQYVVGIDNFATGFNANLDEIKTLVGPSKWANFSFVEGDIRELTTCQSVCEDVDYVLHHAALGSVPRSINDPILTNSANITGFLNILVSARDKGVKSFTYAASSSTYGDYPERLKVEDKIGQPLSPYAVTKYTNELYAKVFAQTYGFNTIGLRYFNVFGARQTPNSVYAAVIPTWVAAMIRNQDIIINGDGSTSRDFCYIDNVIQANVLAATADLTAKNNVYNIALNDSTSLNQLFIYLKEALTNHNIHYLKSPLYRDFRPGDLKHSKADITKARDYLGYDPQFRIQAGIKQAILWYIKHLS